MGCSSSKAVVKAPEEVPNQQVAPPEEEAKTREIMASVKERVEQRKKAQQEQTFMAKETVMSDVEPMTRVDELVTDEPESGPVIVPPIKKKEERTKEESPVCMTRVEEEEPVKDEPKEEEEPAEAPAQESNVKQQQEPAADESTPVEPNQEGPVMLVPSTKESTKKLNDDDSVLLEETAANHGILVVEQVQMTNVQVPHEKEVVKKEEDSWQDEMTPPLKAGADDNAPAAEQEMTATVMNAAASLLEPSLAEKDGQPVAESPVKIMKKGSTTRVESALYPAIQEILLGSGVKATPPAQEAALYPAVQEFILGNHLADGSKGEMEQQQQEEYDEKGMDVVVVETREKVDVETLKAEAQEAAEETHVETGEKSTREDSSHVSKEDKVSDVIKSPPSLVKAPDPRANFSNNKSKMERASIAALRTKAGVQKNKKLFDSNVPPPKVDALGNAISSTIDQFGGNDKKITAVQRRKLELEQREKENKEAADPKSQIKTSWNTAGRPGAYKKKMQHKKGPRSKKNLADLP